MTRQLWLPDGNFQEGNDQHCGNCSRSRRYEKNNNYLDNNRGKCVAKRKEIDKINVKIMSTCSGNESIYSYKIISK